MKTLNLIIFSSSERTESNLKINLIYLTNLFIYEMFRLGILENKFLLQQNKRKN